jgi:hypothetical protein
MNSVNHVMLLVLTIGSGMEPSTRRQEVSDKQWQGLARAESGRLCAAVEAQPGAGDTRAGVQGWSRRVASVCQKVGTSRIGMP